MMQPAQKCESMLNTGHALLQVATLKRMDLPELTGMSANFQAAAGLFASHCLGGDSGRLLVNNGNAW